MATKQQWDKETLAAFYKSGASNFAAFEKAKTKRDSGTPVSVKKAAERVEDPRPISPQTTGIGALKDMAAAKATAEAAAPVSPVEAAAPPPKSVKAAKSPTSSAPLNGLDAASAEYINFLKQQQELQGCHKKMDETIKNFERERREHQAELNKSRSQAAEILASLEGGTNWNLSSEYNVQQLLKDAQLKLQPRELYRPDMQARYLDVVQQATNVQKLKGDHANKDLFNVFRLVIENGARRLDRVEKEIKTSQLDATEMARLPDTLLIQLDHVLSAPTIQMELMDTEEKLEHLLFKLEETKEARAQALDDGEMQLAEKKYYNVVELYEDILERVLEKIATIEKAKKENEVFNKVRENYQTRATEEAKKLQEAKEKLKSRCEVDLKKIFALKERVDAVEQQTVNKLAEEQRASDKLLAENAEQQELTWAKIEQLEKELERLEKERYTEFKKRVQDKDKDEHRRMEYEKFCTVMDKHASLLDLTIRNCDTAIHSITLLAEFVNTGFTSLANHLSKQNVEHSELLLDTHKQHLEMFRGLYLGLGELAHKKDKRIEEIDRAIQVSHIQQELAADTLNPSAKKYSDAKKELLRIRDTVEDDLNDLKEKAQVALNNFSVSEKALHDSGIDFIHPTVEQQELELETKAKMCEYKAIATGNVDHVPIKAELESIKAQMLETRRVVESVNRSTLSNSFPALGGLTPHSTFSQ